MEVLSCSSLILVPFGVHPEQFSESPLISCVRASKRSVILGEVLLARTIPHAQHSPKSIRMPSVVKAFFCLIYVKKCSTMSLSTMENFCLQEHCTFISVLNTLCNP